MTDRARHRTATVLLLAGVVLTAFGLLAGMPGVPVIVLAQPLTALGVVMIARPRPGSGLTARWRRDLPALSVVWLGAPLLLGLLTVGPFWGLYRQDRLLLAWLASGAVAAMVVLSWRLWPVWSRVLSEGGPLMAHRRHLDDAGWLAWRGLGAVVPFVMLAAFSALPFWSGWQTLSGQVPASLGLALLSPFLHAAIVWLTPCTQMQGASSTGDTAEEANARMAAVSLGDQLLAEAAQPPPPLEALVPSQYVPELYEAVRAGRVDRALQLIEAGADVHAPPPAEARDQRQLSAIAAVLPDLRLLRMLIAEGLDLNRVHRGMTPLLAATRDSWHGRPEAVMMLLANGADVRQTDSQGNTALHYAARSADPGVAAQLCDAAAGLDVVNGEGFTPLGVACAGGNWRLARFLLDRGARCEVEHAVPALVAAASSEDDDPIGVQLLLRHKARIDARDSQHRSALHEAAAAGHVAVVDVLLAAGARIEGRDVAGRTPLLDACANGHEAVLDTLQGHRPDLHAHDVEGRNALWLACAADQTSVGLVEQLMTLGVSARIADHAGRCAVDVAAAMGRWRLVVLLDPDYRLPGVVSEQLTATDGSVGDTLPDRTPLSLLRDGLSRGDVHGLQDMARLCSSEELGQLLHEPALWSQPQAMTWLLAHGADPQQEDASGHTPAYALLGAGASGLVALDALVELGVPLAGAGGLARLLMAALRDPPSARLTEHQVMTWLDRGTGLDLTGLSETGHSALNLAVQLGWLLLAERLLQEGAAREARDSQGRTVLHLVTEQGDAAAVQLLVRQGADPQARLPDGTTPLGMALSQGRDDIARWLDWRIWPLPLRPLAPSDLPAAARAGDGEAVQRLLTLGMDVNAVDVQGCTALLHAAGTGNATLVSYLLAAGADPGRAAGSGITPLGAAVRLRQMATVTALLEAGADIEQRLPGGVSVLMLATTLGLPDMVSRLVAAGADVHATDARQLTALHCAAQFGYTARDRSRLLALFDALLLAGADPNRTAGMELTPLLLLLGAGAEPGTPCDIPVVLAGLERLIDEGVQLETRDARGFGPLHLAALHGQSVLVQRLLRAGVAPSTTDAQGRTPREIAQLRGYVDVAGEFLPAQPGATSLARFLRSEG